MRRRQLWVGLLAAAACGATAPAARAQVFVGPAVPRYAYGFGGFYPSAYSSSWSNGFSLYGPPVPTYGSVPGAFGGADQRLNPNLDIRNGAQIGLGRSGAGGGGPRRRHYAEGGFGGAGPMGQQAVGQAAVEVRVPAADAEVYFEGTNTRQQGTKRQFLSPPLPVGPAHFYKIRARWKQGDEVKDETRSVAVKANETAVVDFTQAEPSGSDKRPVLGQD